MPEINVPTYTEFLAAKATRAEQVGPTIQHSDLHPTLYPFQRDIVTWAAGVGRAAVWADTGLGKTFMQVEWMRRITDSGLIVAPLAICRQTIREAAKLGVQLTYRRDGVIDGHTITNYEMLHRFDPADAGAMVLDESSILKNSNGKMRSHLIDWARTVPFRLACSATPAPNDPEELTNQAAFLGHMTRVNMLAAYFVHDQDGWRIKGHARRPMFRWMSTWATAIRKPSDLGYPDDGYDLPGLRIIPEVVDAELAAPDDALFFDAPRGVTGRSAARRQTLTARVERAAELVAAEPSEPWILWCGLNDEATELARATGGVNVHGSMSPEEKAEALMAFADDEIQVLITKPSIASQGLNYQHCARMAFVGLSDSYEQYYQAIRRCHRYGQTRVVNAHIVLSQAEQTIAANVSRKESEAASITDELIHEMTRGRAAA